MNIIETTDLSKTYRRLIKPEGLRGSIRSLWKREYEEKRAVRNMSLEIEEGEFVGLIGPNGAGKTTLTKLLTGIIAPTSGKISVMGFYPNDLKNEFKKQYAVVMGQKSQLFYELTANDTLRLFKEIYELDEKVFRERKDYFAELFQVKELMDVQVRTLSLGERMKFELMAALIHRPGILFLDEPTIGLDAVASRQIRKFLWEVNRQQGTTIILTSHYMEDIRALCPRSIVMNHGCKAYDGKTEALFAKYQMNKQITVCFGQPMEKLELPFGAVVKEDQPFRKVIHVSREESGALIQSLMRHHPVDIAVEEEEIGAVVERIYRENGEEAGEMQPEPDTKKKIKRESDRKKPDRKESDGRKFDERKSDERDPGEGKTLEGEQE